MAHKAFMHLADFPATIVDGFARQVDACPEHVAVSLLERTEVRVSWTRAELWRRAQGVAHVLGAAGVRAGDRVLVLQPDGPELGPIFFGIWLCRAVALMPPAGLAAAALEQLVATARPALTIGTAPGCLDAMALAADAPVSAVDGADWPRPSDVAFVQYGSGPQLRPRGIVLSHRALAANVRALAQALGLGPADRALSWSPMSHDMGLVGGLLMALWCGYPVDLLKAEAVLVQPLRWLEAVAARGATITAGPNFAWQMCVRRVREADLARLDLSRLRVALTGSELIQAETCRAFGERFAPAGFRGDAFTAAYGLAEHVLAVCLGGPGRPLKVLSQGVALGRAFPGHDVRLAPDGEILVRGPSLMDGYLEAPEETARAIDADGWLHTGDLGAFEEGELVFLGRRKDMVIRRGKNFYIADVEALVARDPAVSGVFATAIPDAREATEGLVILAESVRCDDDAAGSELCQSIVGDVLNHLGLGGAQVRLARPGSLPRAGADLDRDACRRLAMEALS